ncbi:MAG: hypothetical protein U5K30_02610 [Acidimicrobiales bacterium]|nr:hypothetical protein [Acidimicrobiales bacterium]
MLRSFRRRPLLGLAAVIALTLVAAACEVDDWAEGGEHRPWYCDPTDTAINDGHDGGHDGHEPHYTEEKGPLSAEDCLRLNVQLNMAKDYAQQFPTAGVAEANGWTHLAPWIPGQGTHHVNDEAGITTEFNPRRPNLLMYDSNLDSGQLTGMVWAVVSPHGPPEGFPGDNDHWHAHESLCFNSSGFIIGDSITDEECESRGGTNVDTSDTWLLHVWLPVYEGWYATDIFNKEHPTI